MIEARRIADELALTRDEFVDKYIERYWLGSENFLLRRCDGACVSLENVEGVKITRCFVHRFKPYACAEWNPSVYRKERQEGLAKY